MRKRKPLTPEQKARHTVQCLAWYRRNRNPEQRAQRVAKQRAYAKTPRGMFQIHKSNAGKRGLPFLMTFAEWWSIWQASGHWEQRGSRSGQYVMARYGDRGGYEVGNVRIITTNENGAEIVPSFATRAKISAANRLRRGSQQREELTT
jgi:hypothetical protein